MNEDRIRIVELAIRAYGINPNIELKDHIQLIESYIFEKGKPNVN